MDKITSEILILLFYTELFMSIDYGRKLPNGVCIHVHFDILLHSNMPDRGLMVWPRQSREKNQINADSAS